MGLAEDVAALDWYHTIELPGGVVTPGGFDTRAAARAIALPASLAGKRCLDVGTSDGFWAFEMERRGAAEVIGIDLPTPSLRDLTRGKPKRKELNPEGNRRAFALAKQALDSKVTREELSVYDLSPERMGMFDFVFMGNLMIHLRDPIAGISRVRSVTRGEFFSYESISMMLSLIHPRFPAATLHGLDRAEWWLPNKAALRRMIQAGGFDVVSSGRVSFVKSTKLPKLTLRQLRRRPLFRLLLATRGVPQTWVLARPAAATPRNVAQH